MEVINTEYRGFNIVYSEYLNKWKILDDGEHGEREMESLASCRELIDGILKREGSGKKKFKHTTAIVSHPFSKVTVTSFAGISYGRHEYWVTHENGKRSKEAFVMEYDEDKYKKITALMVQKSIIDEEISKIKDLLKPLTITGDNED